MLHEVIPYQDFGLVLVKRSEVPVTLFLLPVENFRSLSACPPAYQPLLCLGIICRLAEGELPIVQVINKDVKQYGSQYLSLRDTVINQPTVGLCIPDHTTP